MKKILKTLLVFVLSLGFVNPEILDAETVENNTKKNKCVNTHLSVDKEIVDEDTKMKVIYNYESVEPACTPDELLGEEITIDLSSLVSDGSKITLDAETDHFFVDIDSNGIITLTFKDLSSEGETLTGFGGDITFTVTAKKVVDDEVVTISDSEGNEVDVTINSNENYTGSSNKYSVQDYVEVGDVIDYVVQINKNENHVEKFYALDKATTGLEYVPGSFWVEENNTWINADEFFVANINADGNGEVRNTKPFDKTYIFHYQMKVTEQHETYKNTIEVHYDDYKEYVNDYISFDIGGGSWIEYDNGYIELDKVDQDGNALEGVEFTIYDEEGKEVEVLITDSNGNARSGGLPLGNYTIIETKTLSGYQLDKTEYKASITTDQETVEINGGNPIVNYKVDPITPTRPLVPNIELPIVEPREGLIDLLKIDEKGNALKGAEFTIYDIEGNEVQVLTTDEKGYAISDTLPLGDYVVYETKAPEGYELNRTKFAVEIHETGQIAHVNEGKAIVNYLEKPEVIDPEKPEVVDPEKPEVVDPEKPEVVDPEKPEVVDPEKPEVVDPEKPEVVDPEEPEESTVEKQNKNVLDKTGNRISFSELAILIMTLCGLIVLKKNITK